ncbi:MAG TPA: PatB family C-S lyase [Prolixibacteraceae bacterium]|nr:PatB family C-S lyase [Prolixibacteraceae bacterium]
MLVKYNFDEIVDRNNTNCEKYDSRKAIFGNKNVIPMWVADTDFRTPDFIVDAVKKRAAHEVYGYPQKPTSYYHSIQGWLKRQHQWEVETDAIIFSPNVVVGLASLVLSLTNPGDKIIVQPPVYFPFFHVIESNDRVVVENPLVNKNGRYHFDFDDLKSKIDADTKMLLLCNPHNPGGMVWTLDELTELGKICIENNIIVVSDEIHADLVFPEYQHIPFASISDQFAQSSVVLMAASKTFNMTGLSSSFVVISNPDLKLAYNKLMRGTHLSSGNFFGYVATEAAFTHGDEWLSQLITYLEGNRDYLEKYIAENIPALKVMHTEATYLSWIDLSGLGLNINDAFQKLIDQGVGLSIGNMFGTGGENFVRLNFGCPRNVLVQGLEIMKKAFV